MTAPATIRILLVDDHYVVRIGVAAILQKERDLRLVAEAEDGAQALTAFRTHQPDVTLMDMRMPECNGVEATRAIRAEFPAARIIMLTTYDGDEDIFRALDAGALGYLLKDAAPEELLSAIRSVHAGGRYIPVAVAARLAERSRHEALSEREISVLRLVMKGLANKQIAEELHITEATVKAHVSRVMEKMGVPDRTRAVAVAIERGILRLE